MAEPHEVGRPEAFGDDAAQAEATTAQIPSIAERAENPGLRVRMFGSATFFRLWLTQVVSAIGDWLGFLAIAALATRVGAGSPEASVGVVMAARIAPGFFLGPVAGVLADRWNRKRLMVVCDLGRAAVLVTLPFVDTVIGLVAASLVLEVFTLLWAPSKEASVPHLVPQHHLTTANSLSLVAAYGTMPVAAALFSGLSKLGDIPSLDFLRADQLGLAFYVDALTFAASALMISTLPLPSRRRSERAAAAKASHRRIDFGQAFRELKEGWQFIFINPVVRAVNVGLATGLIGGGMLVPLGPVFAKDVLGAGDAGFGFFIFALGIGVAVGVVTLSVLQRHVSKDFVFTGAVFGAGASLMLAASMTTLWGAASFVTLLGVCAGAVYVLGFTLLHEHVDDDLRGRIFGALNVLVRFSVLVAFAVGPLLSELLDKLSESVFGRDRHAGLFGLDLFVPGVRLTLWLAAVIIIGAGVLAALSLRAGRAQRRRERDDEPTDDDPSHERAGERTP